MPARAQLVQLPVIPRTTVTDQAVTQNSLQATVQVVTVTISARVAEAIRPPRLRPLAPPVQTAALSGLQLTAAELAGNLYRGIDGPLQGDPLQEGPVQQVAETGAPAAAGGPQWAAWGNGTVSWLKDHFETTAFNGRVSAPLLGVDRTTGSVLYGLSLGYERIDIDTEFNNGSLIGDGVSVTPYVGVLVTNDITLDAGLGYTRLSYGRDENSGRPIAVERDFTADRLTAFSNLTAYAPVAWVGEQVSLSGQAGVSWTVESQGSSRDSQNRLIDGGVNRLGRATAGVRASRVAPLDARGVSGWEPMASLTWQVDFYQSDDTQDGQNGRPRERSDVLAGLGVAYGITPALRLTAEYNHLFARRRFDSQSVILSGRLSF